MGNSRMSKIIISRHRRDKDRTIGPKAMRPTKPVSPGGVLKRMGSNVLSRKPKKY